jgi:hypothetical protein
MQLAPTDILLMLSLLLSSQSVVGVPFFKAKFQLVPLFASSLARRSQSLQLTPQGIFEPLRSIFLAD